ncbi:MAG: DUF3887 domain-containing protein [Microcoleus sp. SIO2G3]|nr:DUF3887 domain-containing protein [Microcoleus sp. SIO2G3]
MKVRFMLATAAIAFGLTAISSLPALSQSLPSASVLTAQAPDTAATAQTLISLLASGDYAGARNLYDPANTSVTPETIRQNWSDVISQYGDYQQQVNSRTVPLENPVGGTLVIVTVQFANGRSNIYLTFNPEGQAVSFDVAQE